MRSAGSAPLPSISRDTGPPRTASDHLAGNGFGPQRRDAPQLRVPLHEIADDRSPHRPQRAIEERDVPHVPREPLDETHRLHLLGVRNRGRTDGRKREKNLAPTEDFLARLPVQAIALETGAAANPLDVATERAQHEDGVGDAVAGIERRSIAIGVAQQPCSRHQFL